MNVQIMKQEERSGTEIDLKIRKIDRRLEDLRGRRQKAEADLSRITREENRGIRNFADSTGREKNELRRQLEALAGERTDHEREMAGLASAIAEAEQERTALLPAFERENNLRHVQERQKKLDTLRQELDHALAREHDCDRALLLAREEVERHRFAWQSFRDQEHIKDLLSAREAMKVEWQKSSGPFAQANRR